ncbi:MAG: dodecin family protein [Candidatus Bathyarchaeota archaeon]|nr:dodecin family protein [Candidatus Bathyarchaeota archaeon]
MTVVKIVELIGSSPKSWEEAAINAVKEAAKTVRNIKGVDVKRFTAKCARAIQPFHKPNSKSGMSKIILFYSFS